MIVKEGFANIEVDDASIPEKRRKTGFYNPDMRENRDIAVLALKWFSKRHGKGLALDAFSATGVRAIRFEKESGWDVVATEVNETAFERLKKNLRLNNCRTVAKLKDCRKEMMDSKFQAIDIDPYGSPSQFIEFSALGLDKKSLLMVTATDTANLFGVYPRKCEKLYGIIPERRFSAKEIGVRILITYIIRELGKYDKAFMPLLSYSYKHYVRVIGFVQKSSSKTYEMLSQIEDWKGRRICLGKIKDNSFIDGLISIAEDMETVSPSTIKLLSSIRDELDVTFYYDSHSLRIGLSMEKIRERLEGNGWKFSRTHFSPTAFKTDADEKALLEVLGK